MSKCDEVSRGTVSRGKERCTKISRGVQRYLEVSRVI